MNNQRGMRRSAGITSMVSAAVLAWGVCPAGAINIVLNFEDTLSSSPSFDPFTGTNAPSGLQAMFQQAESFYQDVFEDNHTLTINYWYTDLPDGLRGQHSVVSQSGGRETVANIRIDTTTSGGATRNWFIDPTPASNTEFNMQQTLWRDLTGAQQTDWYTRSGTAIDTFEAGFGGNAIPGLGATGAADMLSVVMHEVGHALGMSAGNTSTVSETNDGDYDFDSVNIFGRTLAAETANIAGDDNLNIAHFENTNTLMPPSVGTGRRRLPSHTDLLAMAAVHNYTDLDIPRREFYGGSNWNTSGNWVGNTVPGSADDVFIRDAQGSGVTLTAGLSGNGQARDIQVSEGANIDTNAFRLDASGDVTVTGLDTDIFINPGGELEADEVFIQDQAEIEMSGGLLDVRRVTIDAGTQIQSTAAGSATVQVSNRLINNGQLVASGDSLLFFSTTTPTPWDLDGTSGDGTINASNGRIWFDTGAMSDSFSSEVTVGAGQFFRFDAPWTLDGNGTIDLNGGATFADRARIVGGVLTATGSAEIEVRGQVHFDNAVDFGSSVHIETGSGVTNVEFNATADIDGSDMTIRTGGNIEFDATTNLTGTSSVNTINNLNSTLTPRIQFDAQTNYSSYTLNKTGSTDLIVQQTGNARFVGTNTINADTFDMDGFSGNTVLTFGDGVNSGSLILNVDNTDTVGSAFNGTIDLSNAGFFGALTVNLSNPADSWTMAGTADLGGNIIFYSNRINGSRVVFTGTTDVNSLVGINADATLANGATVNFSSTSSGLGFRGDTEIHAGVTFIGGGTVDIQSTGTLTFFDNAALGSSDLRNRGVLSIDGTTDASVNDFTQTSNGQWDVNLAGSSSTLYDVLVATGDINLDGTLALTVTGGYDATLYQTHTILNGIFAASLAGNFSTIEGVVLDATTGLAVTYTSQDVLVQHALLGDANLDGFISQSDLDAVLLNWGNIAGMWTTGDFDGDGFVAQADLDAVLLNWGNGTPPVTAIPEPAALTLLGLGSLTLLRRRG